MILQYLMKTDVLIFDMFMCIFQKVACWIFRVLFPLNACQSLLQVWTLSFYFLKLFFKTSYMQVSSRLWQRAFKLINPGIKPNGGSFVNVYMLNILSLNLYLFYNFNIQIIPCCIDTSICVRENCSNPGNQLGDHMTLSLTLTRYRTWVAAVKGEFVITAPA